MTHAHPMLLLWTAVFFGGLVSGFSGFAFAAIAGAILIHVYPPMAAIPLLMVCGLINQAISAVYLRGEMDWRSSMPLVIGGGVGLPIGLLLLRSADTSWFRLGFGIFLIGYATFMVLKPSFSALGALSSRCYAMLVGFGGGVVGGLTAMPGAVPTIWFDLQGRTRQEKRGLLQPFIMAMQALSLPGFFLMKDNALDASLVVTAIPALAAGTLLGASLYGRVNDAIFRFAVLGLLLFSGVVLVR
ncbi:MAG: sulfite exporter TauE/SafE family protein [Alphaproteobacteria bacterium]|nr:sulfite exporter TauE/SafE family protein [Alphaproteobacteria bacterium]